MTPKPYTTIDRMDSIVSYSNTELEVEKDGNCNCYVNLGLPSLGRDKVKIILCLTLDHALDVSEVIKTFSGDVVK
jgi:hypothetical protein